MNVVMGFGNTRTGHTYLGHKLPCILQFVSVS